MVNDNTTIKELKCGVILHLQPVSQAIINSLSSKMMARVLDKPGKSKKVARLVRDSGDISDAQVLELFGDDIGVLATMGDKLFDYCAGWGVINDPPKKVGELVRLLLGGEGEGPYARRAAWVRSLLSDEEEGWDLVSRVQALSREPETSEKDEPEVETDDDLKAKIAELEAKLEATE